MKELIKTKFVFYLPIIILSFVIMLFYTRCSPLFFTNNWVDANAFMTMGKGIVHGLIPYKDLFEQKGPILYFIHSIAYILFPNTFYAIYIFESIAMALNMILFYKIAKIFINKHLAYLLSFFLPTLILNYFYFIMGDSAEEFAIPGLMFLIYSILSCLKNNELSFSKRTLFLHGLILAGIFWTKYTLIGAWVVFFVFYGIYLIWKRQFVKLLQSILISLTGFMVVSLLVLTYFLINNGLKDLYEVYFFFNINSYSSETTIWIKTLNMAVFFLRPSNYSQYVLYFLILAGISFVIYLNKGKNYIISLLYFTSILFTIFIQYFGGHTYIKYYLLIIIPFAAIGLIGIAWLLEKIINIKWEYLRKNYLLAALPAIIFPFLFNDNILYSRLFPNNSDQYVKSPMNSNPNSTISAQREFAKIINKVPNATLLNYGFLDWGFYLAADILPNVRFFEMQNIDYKRNPINQIAQDSYIKEKKTDFVVLVESENINIGLLEKNYQLVAIHIQTSEGNVKKYLLYQKREN